MELKRDIQNEYVLVLNISLGVKGASHNTAHSTECSQPSLGTPFLKIGPHIQLILFSPFPFKVIQSMWVPLCPLASGWCTQASIALTTPC